MEFLEIDKQHIGDLQYLGNFIAFCRAEKGLSQRQLALYADISNTELHRIETAQRQKPSPKILEKIARVLDIEYEILLQYAGYLDLQDGIEININTNLNYNSLSNEERDFILSYLEKKWNNEKPTNSKYISKSDIENMLFIKPQKIDSNITGLTKKTENSAIVLVYGTIPAGVPMEMIEDVLDTEEIDRDMLKGGKQYFGLRIKGNSMYPDYKDGDTIILEKVDNCESGQDCVVMVNGNDGTFKRVFKNENGIILQPLNSEYQPMIYSNEQIDKMPIKIIGKVVELRRKF